MFQNYRATVAHNTISANQRSDSVTQSLSTNLEEMIKLLIYSIILIASPIGKCTPSTFHSKVNQKPNQNFDKKSKVMATLLFSIGLVFVFCHTTKLVSSSKLFFDNISFTKTS